MDDIRNDNNQPDYSGAEMDNHDDTTIDAVNQANDAIQDTAGDTVQADSPGAGMSCSDPQHTAPAGEIYAGGAHAGEVHTENSASSRGPETFGYQAGGPVDADTRKQTYYSENIKKTRQRKTGVGHLILVSLISSLLGAGMMFAAVVYVAPMIDAKAVEMLGLPMRTADVSGSEGGIIKKIEIAETSSPVEAIAEKVSPSIVGIQITVPARSSFSFFFDISGDGVGYGSGIIIREDGYILTNNHVIEAAMAGRTSNALIDGAKIEVIMPDNKDKPYKAQVVGRDEKTDIAVLKIDAVGLPAAEMGDSDEVKVGELAVAIGNPGGMDYMGSVTAGVISGINRTITFDNGQEFRLLQTDAAINPGNSGGALVNSRGQVIGINTVKAVATDVEGLGFAIPINEASRIANSLIQYGYPKDRPSIGVVIDTSFTKEDADRMKAPNGLWVNDVQPGSAAEKAGIQPFDIIVKFDGREVRTFSELENLKLQHKPGDEVEMEVFRNGVPLKLKIVLDEEKRSN